VVRGSRQGESHGGVYLVDFARDRAAQVLDWNTMDIDWQGRGWDRGLRGIAIDVDVVYIAASDELFAYDRNFGLLGSWRNRYLKHCHEICRHERTLFLTSTGFDAVLGFDLDTRLFNFGLQVQASDTGIVGRSFDRNRRRLAFRATRCTSTTCTARPVVCTSAVCAPAAYCCSTVHGLQRWVTLPEGTHNARPFRDGVVFNDTGRCRACRVARMRASLLVPRFAPEHLDHLDDGDATLARQSLRGDCVWSTIRPSLADPRPRPSRCTDLPPGRTRAWPRSATTCAIPYTGWRCGLRMARRGMSHCRQ
jgi:hypothetical protein